MGGEDPLAKCAKQPILAGNYLKQGLIGVSPTTYRKPTRRIKKVAEMP